jgi:hypothetical protein
MPQLQKGNFIVTMTKSSQEVKDLTSPSSNIAKLTKDRHFAATKTAIGKLAISYKHNYWLEVTVN